MATVLHLRSGRGGIILVVLDLYWLDPLFSQALRKHIAKDTALSEDNVLIACTHTHSGPVTDRVFGCLGDPSYAEPDPAYLGQVREQVVAAAARAAATTTSVEIVCTGTTIRQGNAGTDGYPVDILAVRTIGGPVFAAVVVSPIYPRLADPSVTEISADYPDKLRQALQAAVGEACTVLSLTAPCSDLPLVLPMREGEPFSAVDEIGGVVASGVAEALKNPSLGWVGGDPVLAGKRATAHVPRRILPTLWDAKTRWAELRAQYAGMLSTADDPGALEMARRKTLESNSILKYALAEQNGKLDGMLGPYRTQEVQVLRLHEGYLVGLPGMLSAAYAETIRRESPKHTCIVQPVNGSLQGYVLTPAEADSGHSIRLASPFAPQAGDKLVPHAVSLVRKLAEM